MNTIDFTQAAPNLARQLIGWELSHTKGKETTSGIIIETEAYDSHDPASHSHCGPTAANAAMFMSPGTIYIYQIYGLHHCFNIVCGNHDGQAVLIRALKPTKGISIMQKRRGLSEIKRLCNGPANLVSAMGITSRYNGHHFTSHNLRLKQPDQPADTRTTTRIGITKAVDTPWRFVRT